MDEEEFEDDLCEGCGNSLIDSGQCPMCCEPGMYAPGTEECDWCGECSI